MFKRLLTGLLKGILVGGAIGAGVHFGLGWTHAPGLLGYLIAMGSGATAGLLTGRPPWQQQAWVEGVLKALVGLGMGALLRWLAVSFASVDVPMSVADLPQGKPWPEAPLLLSPLVAALYGAFVELDNTGDGDKPQQGPPPNRKKSHGAGDDPSELLKESEKASGASSPER